MSLNDLETNQRCTAILILARRLSELMAQGKEHQLAMALSDIEMFARDAQYRLNDLFNAQDKCHPLREPMGS